MELSVDDKILFYCHSSLDEYCGVNGCRRVAWSVSGLFVLVGWFAWLCMRFMRLLSFFGMNVDTSSLTFSSASASSSFFDVCHAMRNAMH